jgi:hypothetical protein
MKQTASELQQLKGVGSILVQRFQEAGFDSFSKIAQADQEELKKIKGLNPRNIGSIQEQAKAFLGTGTAGPEEAPDTLLQRLGAVKEQVLALGLATRDRFPDQLDKKCGKKVACELACIDETLQRLNLDGKKGKRRAGKALDKVQKRIAGLAEDAPLKKLRKTLKRARKAAQKAVK